MLRVTGMSIALCLLSLQVYAARIEVDADRVLLGDVVRGVSAEVSSVDLGPSPEPGFSRIMTRRQVKSRLAQAMVKVSLVKMPKTVRVYRPKQIMSELQLKKRLVEAMEQVLPDGFELLGVHSMGGLVLPRGPVNLKIKLPRKLRRGRLGVRARVSVGGQSPRLIAFSADIEEQVERQVIIMSRGSRVMIVAKTGQVTVQSHGVAQQNGRLGEVIAVLPKGSRKLVYAKVKSGQRVEVEL
jgi:hypothetical protein